MIGSYSEEVSVSGLCPLQEEDFRELRENYKDKLKLYWNMI